MNFFKDLFRNKKNFNNVLSALCIGILLLIMGNTLFTTEKKDKPQNKEMKEVSQISQGTSLNDYEDELEKKLEQTLGLVEGVGRIKVMITLKNNKEIVVKEDVEIQDSQSSEEETNGDKKKSNNLNTSTKTVLVNGDTPFVINEMKPQIEGIIIVAEGGNDINIKNSLINASVALLGVDINKIEVLKMK